MTVCPTCVCLPLAQGASGQRFGCAHGCLRRHQALCCELFPSRKMTPLSCCLCRVWFSDENSNQSSVSDVYQLKVDSSTNSSPSPQQSESLSPAHTSDFRTDDSQPPTLGQEILEGESQSAPDERLGGACTLEVPFLWRKRLEKVPLAWQPGAIC